MKVLVFGAAFREGSLNKRLAALAGELLSAQGIDVDLASFREFEMPLYDGDLEEKNGQPQGATKLADRIRAADAVVISTPEYNGGIPGTLKNAIDWVSREDEVPLDGKPLLLLAASPGGLGGVRSLWHTRVPFEALGTYVYPEMFGLPKAGQTVEDDKTRARLDSLLMDFMGFAKALRKGANK